jgi:hypothetical protein
MGHRLLRRRTRKRSQSTVSENIILLSYESALLGKRKWLISGNDPILIHPSKAKVQPNSELNVTKNNVSIEIKQHELPQH